MSYQPTERKDVEYIWAGQDPMLGIIIAINPKTNSALIETDEHTKIRTKRWWYPRQHFDAGRTA